MMENLPSPMKEEEALLRESVRESILSESNLGWMGPWGYELDLLLSDIPVIAPSPSAELYGLRRATEDASESSDRDGRYNTENHTSSRMDRSELANPSDRSLWAQAKGLLLSSNSRGCHDATVDQESLKRALSSMQKIFLRHEGSKSCVLCMCSSLADFSLSQKPQYLDVDRLTDSLWAATQSEREAVIRHHMPPRDPRVGDKLRLSFIDKVDFVLENHEHWSAIRLQEFRIDEKFEVVRNRKPPLSTSLDLPDTTGTFPLAIEEPATPSFSDSSALFNSQQSFVYTPASALRKEYRQHAKDLCVFVPFQNGKCGFAREVTERVDVELIKLWLGQCESNHSLCSQQRKGLYPPGLILIDAEMMCLVPMAPDDPMPYIALSYVWGSVAQPTLTKAALKFWVYEGQLRNVCIPQTIRDAIQLVQMIGYRYLWVDALCIVQDDKASRHSQISQMHEIYRHADMTIVAAEGENCSNGLPGVRFGKERVRKHRRYDLPGLSLMKVPSSIRHEIETSPWRSRGWTFQEELCSRKTLVLLPDVMFFSCASAVFREDLQLEAVSPVSRSEEGLVSMASMLHRKTAENSKDFLPLFQDLVKRYMQRTLSRNDDMENAFAGVSGILEPLFGPAYHGIPEGKFVEVIHGCWFWDTSLQRRIGFPSWSWTGWIYRREQADVGIQPLSTGWNMSQLVTFYKVSPSGIELLGQPRPAGFLGGDFLAKMDVELRNHFIPDEEEIQSKWLERQGIRSSFDIGFYAKTRERFFQKKETQSNNEWLQHQGDCSTGLIAFYTSVAYLRLRTPPGSIVGLSREYHVLHPRSNRQLTRIRLNVAYVAQNGTLLPFIVVYHNPDKRSFRLMLISMDGNTAERVNVTVQGRLVTEADWKDANPKKQLIFMS